MPLVVLAHQLSKSLLSLRSSLVVGGAHLLKHLGGSEGLKAHALAEIGQAARG